MTVAKRFKWFVPAQDGRQYRPFGIDCEGAATLFGHRGGWNRTGVGGPDQPSARELAAENRAFWAGSGLPPIDQQNTLGSRAGEKFSS
ncbi:hypothetical protein [Micromonospora sp. C97]|uniref:hypothetical protein n=1 Tax=Micromonospora sp. C97 TaxID=2824883 RepID=UPI001B358573|nr:hypothetical protein [Micromonospora sp. C97]